MDHEQIGEWLSAHADGELTSAQREALELHLAGCDDCQRILAELRLTRSQLELLADRMAKRWQPDVVASVNERIQRRRRWLGWGRRWAVDAAKALAVGAAVIGGIWLLKNLPVVLPAIPSSDLSATTGSGPPTTHPTNQQTNTLVTPTRQLRTSMPLPQATFSSQPDPVPQATHIALTAPDAPLTLHLFSADLLREEPASDAVRNLGFRLAADANAYVLVEVIDGAQMVLHSVTAPSIYLPPSVTSGDHVRLFAATLGGVTTPAAEFTVRKVDEGWQAHGLRQVDVQPTVRVEVATPTPEVVDLASPQVRRQEVVLRLERVYLSPERPRQGEPYTVTAVIRNMGDEDARAVAWIAAFADIDSLPVGSSLNYYVAAQAGRETELSWDARDQWGRSADLSRAHPRLIFRAGVNIYPPGGLHPSLHPEADKRDNVAETTIDFLPYEPLVSDACAPGHDLWLGLDDVPAYNSATRQQLRVVVHNDGNEEVIRVPLRTTDAAGRRYLLYARWIEPCGGAVTVNVADSIGQLTLPITITLNPSDAPDAVVESDRSNNTVSVGVYAPCEGQTDLWLTADDVIFDGNDLLVTIHRSGNPSALSFWIYVYHTEGGRRLARKELKQTSCTESVTARFEGILAGLRGGYVLVEIDTDHGRIEGEYPQHNNSAFAPLP